MGQIVGLKAKPKRCNLNKLSQLGIPAAGEYILVSYDNSMTANGQGNFDRYIIGDGRTAATALELKYLDDSTHPYIVEEVNKAVADIQPIEITGDVTNAPDEEDLTSEKQGNTDVLKFKDKAYNSALYSGLGRMYLRKNIVTLEGTGKNVLTQAMVNTANTIYHIQYDYDLNGQTITVPAGCVLEFDGGSLANGELVFSNTLLIGNYTFKNMISISGNIQNNSLEASNFHFTSDTMALYCLFHLGAKKITLEQRQYNIDTRIINDGNFGAFIHLESDNVEVIGNGASVLDARGNSELLNEHSYFYFLTFSNAANICVKDLVYYSNDTTIETMVGNESETFGLAALAFTNCRGINAIGISCKNISVGVTINSTLVSNDNYPSLVNGEFDNVGYMCMLNGAENVNISLTALTLSHRCIYFGGVKNINTNIIFQNDIRVVASGVIFQEFWREIEEGEYAFRQCSNVNLLIDAFGSITGNSLVKLLRYKSTDHAVIADKQTSFVMDNMNVQVNLHKGSTVGTVFDSSLNNTYDHNILYRGKLVCNYFEDASADDYPLFIACGSGSVYNNIDFDLDVYVNSQNGMAKSIRATNLTKHSDIRIYSNTLIKLNPLTSIGSSKGYGEITISGDCKLTDRSDGGASYLTIKRGILDKSTYRSVVGIRELKCLQDVFVNATTSNYEAALKNASNIALEISANATFNGSYDRIMNYFAENEVHILSVTNTAENDVTLSFANISIIQTQNPYTIPAGKTLMFEFGKINGKTFVSE